MYKKTFTLRKKINVGASFWLMFLTFIFSAGMTQAQSITCNSLVNISLDENCLATVGADQILEGTYSNYNIFTVTFTNSGLPVNLNSNHIGQTLSVTVTSPTNSCSGLILVEDKLPPVISCQDVIIACNESLPGPITAFDACGTATVTYQDQVQDNQCNGLFQTIITRTHTATE